MRRVPSRFTVCCVCPPTCADAAPQTRGPHRVGDVHHSGGMGDVWASLSESPEAAACLVCISGQNPRSLGFARTRAFALGPQLRTCAQPPGAACVCLGPSHVSLTAFLPGLQTESLPHALECWAITPREAAGRRSWAWAGRHGTAAGSPGRVAREGPSYLPAQPAPPQAAQPISGRQARASLCLRVCRIGAVGGGPSSASASPLPPAALPLRGRCGVGVFVGYYSF